MAEPMQYELIPDKKGVMWDLLLYVPTVTALGLIAAKMWYSPNQTWSYLLVFLASFFFIAGANRIAARLLFLPSAPATLSISKHAVRIKLRNGSDVDLVKDLRFFSDYAGRSFGLTAMDLSGKRRQFVFHKGQFSDEKAYKNATDALRVYR